MIESGKDVRFWSDAHFGHAAIIGMCDRPFANADEMDAAIWAAVEDAASRVDFLLCLGDLSMTDALAVQRQLHSLLGDRQATISGNHDRKNCDRQEWVRLGGIASLAFFLPTRLLREWVDADDANGIDWNALPDRIEFGACHYPIPPSKTPGPSWISLHGHSHGQSQGPLRVDFSVEAAGYRPIALRDALKPALFRDLVLLQEERVDLAAMPAP
jgi:calcineurin-like phosphoesterase family protein